MGNKDKIQRTYVYDQPGMTQVVTREYLQVWGTDMMINRKFLKWYSFFWFGLFIAGYLAVRFINVDYMILSLAQANLLWVIFIGICFGLVAGIILYLRRPEKPSKRLIDQLVQEERMNELWKEQKRRGVIQ